jgi:hypothetical protein
MIRGGGILTAALTILFSFLLTGCSTNGAAGGLIPEQLGKTASTNPAAAENVASGVTIDGGMLLTGAENYSTSGTACVGLGGYDDLIQGGTVTVTTGNGDILGQGFLLPGTVGSKGCVFLFEVTNLPVGKAPYMVEITHRGKIMADKTDDLHYTLAAGIGS